MPYRINGFGTGYYGKANIHRLRAQCEHCKQIGVLESYDTNLFITGLYVPLIPIGGKRILESCPSCTTHRAVPLSSWNKAKEAQKADLLEKLQTNPNDKDALLKALGISIAYQDHGLFELLCESLIGDRTDDADIQHALGQAHRFFGEPDKAADAYRRSLAVKNNIEVHEELALLLLGLKKPQEAEKHIEHLLSEPNKEKLWLPYSLVVAYQAEGMHQEASQVLNKVEQLHPDTAKDKDWIKLRKIADKYQNSQKKVGNPLQLSLNQSANEKGSEFANRIPLLILPLLLVGFLIWHVGTAFYVANNRTIHVVGALPAPYQVSLNGKEVTLTPYQVTKVVLPEGDIAIEAGKGAPAEVAGNVRFETSFWTRPYLSPVMVINPDRLAIFYEETGVYSANPNGEDPPPEFFFNSHDYLFSKIDFPFAALPQTVEVKKSETVRRKAVNILQFPTLQQRFGIVSKLSDPAGFSQYLLRWLETDLDNFTLLVLATSRMPRDKALAYLKPHLSDKPIRVEWHRAYQQMHQEDGQEDAIRLEYKKLVTDSGRDPVALYLLARISNYGEALSLLTEAVKSGKPAPLAHYSLGYHYLCEGKFQEAAKEIDQAKELFAHDFTYARNAKDVYLAARRFPEIYKILDTVTNDPSGPAGILFDRYFHRLIQGNLEGAEEAKKSILIMAGDPNSALDRRRADLGIALRDAQARGDVPQYLRLSQANQGIASAVRMAILAGNFDQAVDLLDQGGPNPNGAQFDDKALTLLALRENHPKAKELKTAFLEEMGKKHDEQELRDIMTKKVPFDMEKIRRAIIHPREKRTLIYLAAKWLPDHAKELRAFAAQLNYQKDDTSLCLKKINP